MILISALAILLFILGANTLRPSPWIFAKMSFQCFLVSLWFAVHAMDMHDNSLFSFETVPLFLGAATLLGFISMNHRQMRRFRREIETQKSECQEHVRQVDAFSQVEKTTQRELDFLDLQFDQTSMIYNSTLAMSATLDFHETLSSFIKSLSHLDGFKNLFLILSTPSEDGDTLTRLVAYQASRENKDIEAYSAGDAEKALFQRIHSLPHHERVSDPQSFGLPPTSFGITPENPAWIVPLSFLKEYTGALVYFHERLLHPQPLELLSMHFSMEIQKTRLYEKIKHLSTIDTLSGAYLKRHFFPLFDEELARHKIMGESLAVLMMDVDRFKYVNDRHGHLMGDQVIKEVGTCVKNGLREEDLICRFGGDEFVVVLPKSSKEQALQVADRLRKSLREISFQPDNQEEFRVSVSLGMACFPDDGEKREALIEVADQRLYEIKKQKTSG